jgi:hypothetical protein
VFAFLLDWYNLPFLIALAGCTIFALLQIVGGMSEGDTDLDIDGDHDVDLDGTGNLDPNADLPDHDGPISAFLGMLGIGKLPLAIVLMSLLGSIGALGLILNSLLLTFIGSYTGFFFPIVICVVLIVSILVTGRISRFIGRFVAENSAVIGIEELVGRAGTVTSASISSSYGRVSLRDAHGTTHTVYAVLESDQSAPERSEVALISYDKQNQRFIARLLH